MHDAAGINDDYPVGRGVFIDELGQFVVLVNLEDHIEIVMLPETSAELWTSIIKFVKLTKAFEKIGFATDAYIGNLTVSPKHLGTALHMQCKFNKISNLKDE